MLHAGNSKVKWKKMEDKAKEKKKKETKQLSKRERLTLRLIKIEGLYRQK